MAFIRILFTLLTGLFTVVATPSTSPYGTGPAAKWERTAGFNIVQPACAEEPWRKEIADICSRTDDSMSLSKAELQSLIERCDKLKPVIESLEETPRKVYRKRLQMCRELFAFVLQSKEQAK
ncbi:MAG: hypothetical protein FD174_1963 [Geobacteraceae bacterium]|nr:MAG: hypothetical protein FD174_1963 [Geobacteraceae bacterium]